MDITANLPVHGSPIVNLQPNPGAAPLATTSGQNPPTVRSFDRWHEIPEEITFQIMQWMMLHGRSRSAPASFAMTSKSFYTVGQAFRHHHLYESAQSILLHPRMVDFCNNHVARMRTPFNTDLENPEDLVSVLANLSGSYAGKDSPMYHLKLEQIPEPIIFYSRIEEATRAFRCESLGLRFDGNRSANRLASQIAKTLPVSTNLKLVFNLSTLGGKDVADLIRDTCTPGRVMAIELEDFENATGNLEVRQALMDVFCGNARVSYAIFQFLETTDMLKELTSGLQEIRHLRLLSLNYKTHITWPVVQALVAAIERRHASGLPRITVTLGLPGSPKPGPESLSFPTGRMQELESLGLFLDTLVDGKYTKSFVNKLRAFVSKEQ